MEEREPIHSPGGTRAENQTFQEGGTPIPIWEEKLKIDLQERRTGKVVIRVRPTETTEVVELPCTTEHAEVERVEVNRFVDEPPSVRREDDVVIIPILEEVAVVERRLMLREEVRIRLRREPRVEVKHVSLRREEVQIVREEPTQEAETQDTAAQEMAAQEMAAHETARRERDE